MEAIKNMPVAIAANFGELHFNVAKEWKGLGGAGRADAEARAAFCDKKA